MSTNILSNESILMNVNKNVCKIFEYPRDSLDRFGDDFCELILSYLRFKDKIRFESVSSQWQRCIYSRQTGLSIKSSRNSDTISELLGRSKSAIIDVNALESILKKCRYIKKIESFFYADASMLEIIANNCRYLEEISIPFFSCNIKEQALISFGQNCGQRLKRINFTKYVESIGCDEKKIVKFLTYCPNLVSLTEPKISLMIANALFFPKLEFIEFVIDSEESLSRLKFFTEKYKKIKVIKTQLNIREDFDSNRFEATILLLSEFINLSEIQLKILNSTDFDIKLDKSFLQMSEKCPELKNIDFEISGNFRTEINLMEVFGTFQNLKQLKISIKDSIDSFGNFGSANSLSKIKNLSKLQLFYRSLNEDHLNDIHIYCPNLRSFSVFTEEKITDKTLHSLAKIENLMSVEIRGNTSINDLITDSGVCDLINNCKYFKSIYFTCQPNISTETLNTLRYKACKMPQINYQLTYGVRNHNDFDQIYKNFVLPQNLSFRHFIRPFNTIGIFNKYVSVMPDRR